MTDALYLLVLTLAVTRLIRLARIDTITAPLRLSIMAYSGADGWLTKLITCSFCVGFWCSFAVIPAFIWPHNMLLIVGYTVLAVAEVAPRILHWEPATGGDN